MQEIIFASPVGKEIRKRLSRDMRETMKNPKMHGYYSLDELLQYKHQFHKLTNCLLV